MKLMFDCREMARLISDRHERALEPGERARFRLHMVICRNCRTVGGGRMAFLHRAMRRLSVCAGDGPEAASAPSAVPD